MTTDPGAPVTTARRSAAAPPAPVVGRWPRALRDAVDLPSTPVVLRAARVVLALALAVVGLVAVLTATARASVTEDIATGIEARGADATTVYRSLADAEATVSSGFLAGGQEPTASRARYDAAIAETVAGLARAARQASDEATGDRIADIAARLPIYTGLVEQARANNRQGFPVAASYLGDASELMQTSMLPTAEALQRRQAQRLDGAYREAGSVPVAALVVAVAALAGLALVQVWLAFTFHRVLNLGLVVATAAVSLGLLWWTVAGTVSGEYLDRSRAHSGAVSDGLGPAQIAALQARAAENLALVERGGDRSDQEFDDRMQRLARDGGAGGALGASARLTSDPLGREYVRAAVTEVSAYREAHERVREAYSQGRYAEAVSLAVSGGPGSAAEAFDRLDAALAEAVDHERAAFAADIARAGNWRTGLAAGSGVLALVAIGGAVAGVGQRLEEYR